MTKETERGQMVVPSSEEARRVGEMLRRLQERFIDGLRQVAPSLGGADVKLYHWLRDGGNHGGGRRWGTLGAPAFNGFSVNFSAVHYDDMPTKRLRSANALSTIIHPDHPLLPSMHMHISWTERRQATDYWRVMADLNPSIPQRSQTERFEAILKGEAGDLYEEGRREGERYFYIPALERHRGVSHFYLEGYESGDGEADFEFAREFGAAVIDGYVGMLADEGAELGAPTDEERARQLAYHTLYFFQVLTLDRGTTSGLLVHDQNDLGILASLPAQVDKALLKSWRSRMEEPQDRLLARLVEALPRGSVVDVGPEVRKGLASVVREHYRKHPEALGMQASASKTPPTVANHGDGRSD